MPETLSDSIRRRIGALDPANSGYAIAVVDILLDEAGLLNASDIHLLPSNAGLEMKYRVDGVLQPAGILPMSVMPNVIARLKVMANLQTYRSDRPQEGRIRGEPGQMNMRVSTFPTVYGEKVVIRLFAGIDRYLMLEDLGFPTEIRLALGKLLGETSGAILLAGPAGSGKTTALYACLRELIGTTAGRRSLATIEDPIEVLVPGVAQSQINLAAGLDLSTGLRSMLRQDAEVVAVGEMRDLATAEIAFQASLTGNLLISTFHAGGAAGVVGRLMDMGIEPYVVRSGLRAIVCQRLVRRLCNCARPIEDERGLLGLPASRAFMAVGCAACRATGYRGRMVLAELLLPDHPEVGRAILERVDVDKLESIAVKAGMVSRWERGLSAVEAGHTDPLEVRRTLGFSDPWGSSNANGFAQAGAGMTH